MGVIRFMMPGCSCTCQATVTTVTNPLSLMQTATSMLKHITEVCLAFLRQAHVDAISPGKRLKLMLCLSVCVRVRAPAWVWIISWDTLISFSLETNSQIHLASGPQLFFLLNSGATAHIAARGLPSKPVPHRGNQPYCSCHGKQAPSPLVPRR